MYGDELPIAPSSYYRNAHLTHHPQQRCGRGLRAEWLAPEIARVYEENNGGYGARKVWKQLKRESIWMARCTVERLMSRLGLEGIRRGKRCVTTIFG